MTLILVIATVLVLVYGVFYLLQKLSDKTYRPSCADIKAIIEAGVSGHLKLEAFDEFSRVRIAYDERLDKLRERFNAIVNDKAYTEGAITSENATPLNDSGKARLLELLRELEIIAAQPGSPPDAPQAARR